MGAWEISQAYEVVQGVSVGSLVKFSLIDTRTQTQGLSALMVHIIYCCSFCKESCGAND